jgi:hypothetical protein
MGVEVNSSRGRTQADLIRSDASVAPILRADHLQYHLLTEAE